MRKTLLSLLIVAALLPWPAAADVPTDTLVKADGSAVYYYASDGKRYVFPNEGTYKSWFSDFSGIVQVSAGELAMMQIGGNVTYRPGIRMVKIQSDPKVYAVDEGGRLRWVVSESLAEEMYGQFWNKAIDDVSDTAFADYTMGDDIRLTDDFLPLEAAQAADTINADKGIHVGPTPRLSDTEVANVVDAWRAFSLDHINQLRQLAGKGPIAMNPVMNRLATIHSRDMAIFAKKLQHEGSLTETPDDRLRQGKVPNPSGTGFLTIPHPLAFVWSGENIGYTSLPHADDTPESGIAILHEAFMDEPPDEPNHRTTMLSTLHEFSEIGIGPYVDDKGDLWLTEDYISR